MNDRQAVLPTAPVMLIDRDRTVGSGLCPDDCLCGGRLTRQQCDRRTESLWASVVSVSRPAG